MAADATTARAGQSSGSNPLLRGLKYLSAALVTAEVAFWAGSQASAPDAEEQTLSNWSGTQHVDCARYAQPESLGALQEVAHGCVAGAPSSTSLIARCVERLAAAAADPYAKADQVWIGAVNDVYGAPFGIDARALAGWDDASAARVAAANPNLKFQGFETLSARAFGPALCAAGFHARLGSLGAP